MLTLPRCIKLESNWNQAEVLPIVKDTIFSLCKSKSDWVSLEEITQELLENKKIDRIANKIKLAKNQKRNNVVANMVGFLNMWITQYEQGIIPSSWFGIAEEFQRKIERRQKNNKYEYKLRSSVADYSANYWIFVVANQGNASAKEIFERNMRFSYWGLKEDAEKIDEIKIGDKAIIYIAGLKLFLASCTLYSQFLDKRVARKRRHNFSGVELLRINIWDKPSSAKIKMLRKLSFLKDIKNIRYWGLKFRTSIIKITENDYYTIAGKENDDIYQELDELDLESNNPTLSLTESKEFTLSKRKKRSEAFRRKVKENYNYSCAVCGRSRFTKKGNPEVESAHIYPVEENGSNDPRNGLALCKLHHWAFENGLFSITDEFSILVYKKLKDNPKGINHYKEITSFNGKKIRLPQSKTDYPHTIFLKQHRKMHGFK